LQQNGVDVGAPSYSVGTEACTRAVESGSFFYTDAGHLQLCMYIDSLSLHYYYYYYYYYYCCYYCQQQQQQQQQQQ